MWRKGSTTENCRIVNLACGAAAAVATMINSAQFRRQPPKNPMSKCASFSQLGYVSYFTLRATRFRMRKHSRRPAPAAPARGDGRRRDAQHPAEAIQSAREARQFGGRLRRAPLGVDAQHAPGSGIEHMEHAVEHARRVRHAEIAQHQPTARDRHQHAAVDRRLAPPAAGPTERTRWRASLRARRDQAVCTAIHLVVEVLRAATKVRAATSEP
jgi:hypothetical protein